MKVGDKQVGAIGLGCMSISTSWYGKALATAEDGDQTKAHALLLRSLELGSNFWDTADIYADNEIVLGNLLKDKTVRQKVFLCTKFGIRGRTADGQSITDGSAAYVRQACESSLKRLQVDQIDLYYAHRIDPNTPIQETVGALAELVRAGKVKYLGLSECSVATLRAAHAVHPITAVQMEYSPWSTDAERNGILDACRELGIVLVAYSPLGRGFLTGAIKSPADFDDGDFRKHNPRFQGENFERNLKLVHEFQRMAAVKQCTAGQLCLAWLKAQPGVLPIPGTKNLKYLEENCAAGKVEMTLDELAEVRKIIDSFQVSGERYHASGMKALNK